MNEYDAARLRRLAQESEEETRDRLQLAHAEYLSRLNQVCAEEFARFLEKAASPEQASPFQRLNQAAQRMLRAADRLEYAQALLDVAPNSAVFVVVGQHLEFVAANPTPEDSPRDSIPLSSAPALSSAVEAVETVVALRSASQLSGPVAAMFGGTKVFIVPVAEDERAAALIVSDSSSDIHALELLGAIGGRLGVRPAAPEPETAAVQLPPSLIQITGATPVAAPAAMTAADYRARRFASVEVAKLLLERPQEVERGRHQGDLYSTLGDMIETSRAKFRQEYISTLPRRVDYYHQELVRTIAHDEETLLGPEYPGPLS